MSKKEFVYAIRAEYKGAENMKKISEDLKKLEKVRVFKGAQQEFATANKDFVDAKNKVRDLRKEMQKPGGAAFAESYKKAKVEVIKLNAAIQKKKTGLDKARSSLQLEGIEVGKVSQKYQEMHQAAEKQVRAQVARQKLGLRSWKEIQGEIDDLERAYKQLEKSGEHSMKELAQAKDRLRQKTERLYAEMGKGQRIYRRSALSLGNLRSTIASLSVLFAGFSGAAFARSIWDAGIASEQLNRSFVAIYEDSGRAAEELEWLRRVADELGFNFRTLAESYRGVAASSKGTILEGKKTQQIFLAVSEASRVLGLSSDQTSGALNAVSQMISKNRVQAEELRGQLGERLFGAFQLVAEAAGVSTEELNKMLERGEVGIDILGKFAKVLHEEYGKSAQEAANDAAAAYGRIQTAWFDFRVALAEGGFLDEATRGINALTNAMQDPAVRQAALDLMNTAIGFGEVALRVGLGIKSIFDLASGHIRTTLSVVTRIASAMAFLTDQVGLTENAYRRFKETADSLWDGAKEEYAQVRDQIKLAATGFDDFENKAKIAGSVAADTFKETAKEAVESSAKQQESNAAALDAMKKKYKEYADEVKRLQDQIAGREQSLAEQLRAMSRTAMSDLGAWRDRKKEADEYYRAAQKAAQAGDFDQAVKLADKAKEAYADLNEEIKSGDKVLVSQQNALKTASSGVKKSGELAIDILKKQEEAAKKAANALNEQSEGKLAAQMPEIASAFGEVNKQAADFTAQSRLMDNNWKEAWKSFEHTGKAAIGTLDGRLIKLTRDRHMKIHVETVQNKSGGGLVGNLRVATMAAGGLYRSALAGMYFPGYGGGDQPKNLVMAEDGEVMIRKEMVKASGLKAALAWNAGRFDIVLRELLSRFDAGILKKKMGGLISMNLPPVPAMPQMLSSGGMVAAASDSPSLGHYTLDLRFPTGDRPLRVRTHRDDREVLEQVVRAAERLQRRSS